jgi:hypothetical protein
MLLMLFVALASPSRLPEGRSGSSDAGCERPFVPVENARYHPVLPTARKAAKIVWHGCC